MQSVEIVLTAHPTQVNRRTLQYKHSKIAALLQQHDRCAYKSKTAAAAAAGDGKLCECSTSSKRVGSSFAADNRS
jgi:phosphoenolpyruvate carboxylase